jgi:lambda family phage portal protein
MIEPSELLGGDTSTAATSPAPVLVPAGAGGANASTSFDAADNYDAALARWNPSFQSADADIIPEKSLLDARTRDVVRNDAYIQGGTNLHKDNIVGSHYLLNTRPSSRHLFGKIDEIWEEEFQEEVEELWDLHSESPDNWIDAQRTNNFTSLIRLAVGVMVLGGEVLAVVEWLREARPFSTAIQMIDTDRLSDPMIVDPFQRNDVRGGIRYDRQGAPISYFIRTEHPADLYTSLSRPGLPEWKEVPIRKPWGRMQVIHLKEQVRPDQSRGFSELTSALREMKFAKKFRSLQLDSAVLQSLYAATITSDMPVEQLFQALGGSSSPETAQETITNYTTAYLSSIAQYVGGSKSLRMDGVRVPYLYPGTKLDMVSPSGGKEVGKEFEQSLLRYIAAALGVSYEQLSRDYTQTNYSSARAAMTETWKFMQARKKLIADRFATHIYRLWLEEIVNKNMLSTFPNRRRATLYTNGFLNTKFDALSRCEWVGASRGQIDELKETEAAVLRIDNGLSTREEELARLGKDFRKVYRQLAREEKMAKAYNLMFGTKAKAVSSATAPEAQTNA